MVLQSRKSGVFCDDIKTILRLFAYYKGDNFNIHIWAWFGYFICLGREIRVYLSFGKEAISFLSHGNVRAFHESPDLNTLTSHVLTLKAHITKGRMFLLSVETF